MAPELQVSTFHVGQLGHHGGDEADVSLTMVIKMGNFRRFQTLFLVKVSKPSDF